MTASSPWGEDRGSSTATSSVSKDGDPFGSAFVDRRTSSGVADPFGTGSDGGFGSESSFAAFEPQEEGVDDKNAKNFGKNWNNNRKNRNNKNNTNDGKDATEDPFGGEYDPFQGDSFREADKFSWDDEPDPFLTDSGIDTSATSGFGNKDAFAFGSGNEDSPDNKNFGGDSNANRKFGNVFDADKNNFLTVPSNINSNRSKSVTGDPLSIIQQVKEIVPQRSKTALGEPTNIDLDFDPFSSSKFGTNADKNLWKSNEDLLNESVSGGGWNNINNNMSSKDTFKANFDDDKNFNFSDNFSSNNNNSINNPVISAASEAEQIAWAAQESLKQENLRKFQDDKEREELELALALSKSMASNKPLNSSRSPSTGL